MTPSVSPEADRELTEGGVFYAREGGRELGGQSIVSAILNGKRELNTRQVKALAKRFNVSPAVFL